MLNKIKLSIAASLFAAALAAPGVVHADLPPGFVLIDSGSSTYQAGFKSGPHITEHGLRMQVQFSGFGLPPDHVTAYVVENGTVTFDCNFDVQLVNGYMSLTIPENSTTKMEIGLCPKQGLPENNQAFTWQVYDIPQ